MFLIGTITAIANSIAQTDLLNASTVFAPKVDIGVEVKWACGRRSHVSVAVSVIKVVVAVGLVRVITTLVMTITAPGHGDAVTIIAAEGVRIALTGCQVLLVEVAHMRKCDISGYTVECCTSHAIFAYQRGCTSSPIAG